VTYILNLPFQAPPASMNDIRRGKGGRSHWTDQRDDKSVVEDAVIVCARRDKIPHLDLCAVRLIWLLPGEPRVDNDGLAVMLKACKDGLIKAGVLDDDRCQIVVEDRLRIITGQSRSWSPAMLLEIEPLAPVGPCPAPWVEAALMDRPSTPRRRPAARRSPPAARARVR
jgi:hypothetical protein